MLQLAVCDDEAVCLRQTVDILRAALGDTPHQLKTFENAPAMLAMLAEDGYRPDIAVLDICMDDMDGITLAKQINRLAPACRVIFLSSYAGYLMDAYEAEHIYYVLKSDEAARLPVALRKALGALSSEKALTVRRGGSYQASGSTRCCISSARCTRCSCTPPTAISRRRRARRPCLRAMRRTNSSAAIRASGSTAGRSSAWSTRPSA